MIPAERASYIVNALTEKGIVSIEELAQSLNVTRMTIRRDLDKLQRQGLAYRSHGGAIIRKHPQGEQLYDVKKLFNRQAKKNIAFKALEYVQDGDTILLDSGTTTYELALLLKSRKNITVVTNDLKIALELYNTDLKVIMIGGEIQKETAGVIGIGATAFVEKIHVDKAFIGCSSISGDWVLCTPSFEKSKLKSQMIQRACQSILLADEDKFNRLAFIEVCKLGDIDVLITNKKFSSEEMAELEGIKTKIIEVDSNKKEHS